VGGGSYSYSFKAQVPEGASGTWAVGIEGYIEPVVQKFGGKTETVRDAGFNSVMYSAVTDAVAMPRKTSVARSNCNQCHQDLGDPAGMSIHGGIRRNTEYCVLCHNPNHTDEARRPADQMPPASVDFKRLIHRIHTGEEGEDSYVVYGFGGNAVDFGEIRFPGDRRNCEKCHLPGSNLVNFLHVGAQPVVVQQAGKVVQTIQPLTAACTACHTSQKAKDHAALQTTPQGSETCIICHGEGADFPVSKVHARP
ncbi:MAG: cytochrome c3 family protein, partial [Chloroflexota bacterium]|nr:cytochrome c3 family protein [Chloroflexota bacterium]